MQYYWLILGILGVWRVTSLLNAEDGPWDIFVRFRGWLGDNILGQLLDCFYCLSFWVAIPFAYFIGETWKERILLWLAMSGAAILLERITSREPVSQPALYIEDKESEDALLRRSKETVSLNRSDEKNPQSSDE